MARQQDMFCQRGVHRAVYVDTSFRTQVLRCGVCKEPASPKDEQKLKVLLREQELWSQVPEELDHDAQIEWVARRLLSEE